MPKKQKKLEETGQLNLFDNTTEIDGEDLDFEFEDIDLESLSGEDLGISESVSDRRVETVRQLLTLKLLREAIRAENPDDRVMADFAEMVLPNLLRLAIGVTAKGGNFFEEIGQSGALVRIKAPKKWGKTSLLLTILEACQQQFGYQIVSLDLQKADQDIIANFNKFLRWICRNCARQLNLEAKLDDYWDEDIGIKMSWTIYFEEYILREIKQPLVLALDGVHRVFEHPKVAEDFFPLIRACYEESKRSSLWQKLRLIIVQSTESYVSLRLEQSPFNVGLPIELQGFGQEQVAELAKKYQLNELATNEIQQLIDLVGGHPALIHLAIYHLSQEQITMPDLIKSATTSTGIYSSHLQLHWVTLQKQPELAAVFQQICQGNQPMIVDPIIAYKLNI